MVLKAVTRLALFSSVCYATSQLQPEPFSECIKLQQSTMMKDLTVDLGYSVYKGFHDPTGDVDVWQGIRFAANTSGSNRWQAPKTPPVDRTATKQAMSRGPQCPQASSGNGSSASLGPIDPIGDEDCLFLDVFAPSQAKDLPVVVFMHGGAFNTGNGGFNFSSLINLNNNSIIGVSIQYRLGAFGFLSSEQVKEHGTPNAGILDMAFALQWIQAYIKQFGGDPSNVTVIGDSAGGGGVALLTVAFGGTLNDTLFNNAIAMSPFMPTQHYYNASFATYQFQNFAHSAGCPANSPDTFSCLTKVSSSRLQNANAHATLQGLGGQWLFLPVIDGIVIQDVSARQFSQQRLNGWHVLTSNVANEAFSFVPTNITTQSDYVQQLRTFYPLLSDQDVDRILVNNPSPDVPDHASPAFATTGLGLPSAINQSSLAAGHQQRMFNSYAEKTFICPSYWLAMAFSSPGPQFPSASKFSQRQGWKYQYSTPPALHGSDTQLYYGRNDNSSTTTDIDANPAMSTVIQAVWHNFITRSDPSIPEISSTFDPNVAAYWPPFISTSQSGEEQWHMLSFNATLPTWPAFQSNATILANAYTWEANRGARCEMWRDLSIAVAEREKQEAISAGLNGGYDFGFDAQPFPKFPTATPTTSTTSSPTSKSSSGRILPLESGSTFQWGRVVIAVGLFCSFVVAVTTFAVF